MITVDAAKRAIASRRAYLGNTPPSKYVKKTGDTKYNGKYAECCIVGHKPKRLARLDPKTRRYGRILWIQRGDVWCDVGAVCPDCAVAIRALITDVSVNS